MSEDCVRTGERRWRRGLLSIALAGLAIRVAFVYFGARRDGPLGDQLFYSAQAIANARGDWFEQPFASGLPAADHPPITALLVTPISWVADAVGAVGSVVTYQRLVMVLVGTISIAAIGYLARSIGGARVGLIAAAMSAVHVNIWINDGLIMAETPTVLIVTVLTAVVLRTAAHPTRCRYAVIGLLSALAALTRPELLLLVPLIAIVLFVHSRDRVDVKRRIVDLATMSAATALVLAPWVAWNQMRFDAPVLLSTNDGLTLAGANCDTTYFDDIGGWDIWCAYATEIPEKFDAAQASAAMRADGLEYWREHLDRYPIVAAARLARVFSVGFIGATAQAATAEGRPVWLSHIGAVQYWILVPLAIIGARRRATVLQRVVLLGTVPIVVAVALVANAYVRFRVPAEVGLVTLAALGIDWLVAGVRRRGISESTPASA